MATDTCVKSNSGEYKDGVTKKKHEKANGVDKHKPMLYMSQQGMQSSNVFWGMIQECGECRQSTLRMQVSRGFFGGHRTWLR